MHLLSFKDLYRLASDFRVSYWTGVVCGTLMLLLFLYPVRKYFFAYNGWGKMRQWFDAHVVLGSVMMLLLVYHTNFLSVRSLNGKFAFYSILLVVISGIFGRYLQQYLRKSKIWHDSFNLWPVGHVPVIYMALLFVLVHVYAIHIY
jgi:hypothetical protein